VVPLVFKTSLGAVRFPEGSTPSLLRQISLTPHRGSSANAFRSRAVHGTRCENDDASLASFIPIANQRVQRTGRKMDGCYG